MFTTNAYDDEDLANPFEGFTINATEQTGGDWYAMMLSASLGGKDIEGASMAGSSEVLMKSNHEFANKHACGHIRAANKSIYVDALDSAGKVVAKNAKKFRGVSKANCFALITEDSLWSSGSMNRVKSASYAAASLVANGVSASSAAKIASDILGEELPEQAMEAVIVPLSALKRDTSVLAKGRSAVFLPHHEMQDIIWEDNSLITTSADVHAAIDWGRITGLAKYIGTMNSIVDSRFKPYAAHFGVPYALVDNHWAQVTARPYTDLEDWDRIAVPNIPMAPAIEDATAYTDNLLDHTIMSVSNIKDLVSNPSAEMLLSTLYSIREQRRASSVFLSIGTDVLNEAREHTVDKLNVGITVRGTDSSANALKSAQVDAAKKNPVLIAKLAVLNGERKKAFSSETVVRTTTKELADALYTAKIFKDATARLTQVLGNKAAAETRMSSFRRKLFHNSSALSDNIKISGDHLQMLAGPLMKIARIVIEGKDGLLYPPPILANAEAALASGEIIRLISEARKYLSAVKEYWGNRYRARAASAALDVKKKDESVKYGMAAKAVEMIQPEWLVNWDNNFLPKEDLVGTYLHTAVSNYTRKRSADAENIRPFVRESAESYAARMDEMFKPTTKFADSLRFVSEKLAYISTDFQTTRVWEVKVVEEPKLSAAMEDFFSFLDEPMPNLADPPIENMINSFKGLGDPEAAAKANGYESYAEAFAALKTAAAFDTESEFTKVYLRKMREEEDKRMADAEGNVI